MRAVIANLTNLGQTSKILAASFLIGLLLTTLCMAFPQAIPTLLAAIG
ncbi:hypothetical protein [Ferrimonas pelagia]|uniref:Uncharacterized protein n=1 Tax=Ferrimonas pelagia TaxID=1177826 RepID=A0ABP9EBF2_9GAMM